MPTRSSPLMSTRSCPLGGLREAPLPHCRHGQFPVQRLALSRAVCRWPSPPPVVRSASDAAALIRRHFADRPQEVFLVLLVDSGNRVLSAVELSVGAIDRVMVDLRLVLGSALSAGAPKLIIAHGHPSGDPTPSADDDLVTRRLKEAAEATGLLLLDHVILGHEGGYFSYADEGRLRR